MSSNVNGMMNEPTKLKLTDEQIGQVCGVLSVGCDEETAAHVIGCAPAELRRAIAADPQFEARRHRAEAAAELSHMQNIHKAGEDVKNWRASVWWLERHSPERFAKRAPGAITPRQLTVFAEILADALRTDVHDEDDCRRIVARLQSLSMKVEVIVGDAEADQSPAADAPRQSLRDVIADSQRDDALENDDDSNHEAGEGYDDHQDAADVDWAG